MTYTVSSGTLNSTIPYPVTLLGLESHFLGRLNFQLAEMKDDITGELGNVKFVCTTADIWRAKTEVPWRNWTLDRAFIPASSICSTAMACKPMTRRHTYNAVAAKLNAVHTAYCISIKVVMTVTDNGSNFVKAFKEFVCDNGNNDADIVPFVKMSSVLSPVNDDDDYSLPLISGVLHIL